MLLHIAVASGQRNAAGRKISDRLLFCPGCVFRYSAFAAFLRRLGYIGTADYYYVLAYAVDIFPWDVYLVLRVRKDDERAAGRQDYMRDPSGAYIKLNVADTAQNPAVAGVYDLFFAQLIE